MGQLLTGTDRRWTRFGHEPRFREGLYRVGRTSYAWMVPNGSWGETNLGLVVCGKQSLLIDTAWDLRFTREFLDGARDILERAPIECVVNTHSDGDHCWGNQLFADKKIVASSRCISRMDHVGPRSLQALKTTARWMKHFRFGGVDALGCYVESMFAPYVFAPIQLTRPTHGFSGETTLVLDGVEIVIREVGPAHTDGDAVVFVPSENVAYAGDLLFVGVTPVMWSGPIETMLLGLQYLLSLDAEVFVPGHGPLANRATIQCVIDYWDFVHEGLQRMFRSGLAPDRAARMLLLDPAFQRRQFARWELPERLVTSATTMYRNWGYSSNRLPEKLATINLIRRQACVAAEMKRTLGERFLTLESTPE